MIVNNNKGLFYLLPLLTLLVMAGCKDRELPDPVSSTPGSISAVVNGTPWESTVGNFRLGQRTISNGATAFVGTGDTLTLIGVQVIGADTTTILLSVKLQAGKVGTYRIRSGGVSSGYAYFLQGLSQKALNETKRQYQSGIINGSLSITEYDESNYRIFGNFNFSMSAPGQTTYTAVNGEFRDFTL